MYTITENALDPDYAKQLWSEYSSATQSHPNWWKYNKPQFNTDNDKQNTELFKLPITEFIANSGYSLDKEFPLPAHKSKAFINRYSQGGSLNWHTDKLGDRACVIFLNPDWQTDQGGEFQYENRYWPKHLLKQRKVVINEEFYKPDPDVEIVSVYNKFNTAVYLNDSEKGILHRTVPVVGTEKRLSLLLVVSDTVYNNSYHKSVY